MSPAAKPTLAVATVGARDALAPVICSAPLPYLHPTTCAAEPSFPAGVVWAESNAKGSRVPSWPMLFLGTPTLLT